MFGLRLKVLIQSHWTYCVTNVEACVDCVCSVNVCFVILHTLLDLQFVGGRNFVAANILLLMSNWWLTFHSSFF